MAKPHTDAHSTESASSSKTLADLDRHGADTTPDPVPMPEDGGHAHSAAAHLGKHTEGHTAPVVNQHIGTTRDQSRNRSK